MKKYILTEEQIKKVIDNLINEQSVKPLAKGFLKNLLPSTLNFSGTPDEIKKIYLNPAAKFKVMYVNGEVKLNGNYVSSQDVRKRTMIITPQTTIELTDGSSISASGMGNNEVVIFNNSNKLYFGLGW